MSEKPETVGQGSITVRILERVLGCVRAGLGDVTGRRPARQQGDYLVPLSGGRQPFQSDVAHGLPSASEILIKSMENRAEHRDTRLSLVKIEQ